MNKISKRLITFLSCLFILTSCSSIKDSFSPEEVISNALAQSETGTQSYVCESEMIIFENEEIVERITLKEWVGSDGKIRVETETEGEGKAISVNNGKEILTYMEDENQVMVFDDPELFEINTPSPKEQALQLLEMIQETHDVEVKGEDEIAGRETFHIIAQPKDSGLYGKQELWIDKQNWMILKMISVFGDNASEVEYKKITFDEQFGDDTFQVDLPDDVEHINIDDFVETTEISLTEAATAFGESFLYFPADTGLKIGKVELNRVEQKGNERNEITLDYTNEGVPYFSLSIFVVPVDTNLDDHLSGEEGILVRGENGLYTDVYGVRLLTWDEAGFRYSINFHDPEFTLEQFIEQADDMEPLE